MIGTIISMKYIGKKTWGKSIVFWLVYLVTGLIVAGILGMILIGSLFGSLGELTDLPDDWDTMTPEQQSAWLESTLGITTEMIINVAIFALLVLISQIVIFFLLAHFWYKLNWILALKVFVVAYLIDVLISFIVATVFGLSAILYGTPVEYTQMFLSMM